jgi:hypothetical protein
MVAGARSITSARLTTPARTPKPTPDTWSSTGAPQPPASSAALAECFDTWAGDKHKGMNDEPKGCDGTAAEGVPPEWDQVELMFEHAVRCPRCQRWVRRWHLRRRRFRHGDPGE